MLYDDVVIVIVLIIIMYMNVYMYVNARRAYSARTNVRTRTCAHNITHSVRAYVTMCVAHTNHGAHARTSSWGR